MKFQSGEVYFVSLQKGCCCGFGGSRYALDQFHAEVCGESGDKGGDGILEPHRRQTGAGAFGVDRIQAGGDVGGGFGAALARRRIYQPEKLGGIHVEQDRALLQQSAAAPDLGAADQFVTAARDHLIGGWRVETGGACVAQFGAGIDWREFGGNAQMCQACEPAPC